MTRRLVACLLTLTLAVGLAACGDDDDSPGGGAAAEPADPDAKGTDGDGSDGGSGEDGRGGGAVDGGDAGDAAPDDPDDADYVDTYVELIVGASDLDEAEARCIATAAVDAAGGADGLSAVGLDPETWAETSGSFASQGLPADDATVERFADDLGSCADGYELLIRSVAPDAGDDVRTCVSQEVDEAEVRLQLALSSVRGGDAVAERDVDVFDLLEACQGESLPG